MGSDVDSKRDEVLVDEAGLASFPASDPPAWTGTHAGPPLHTRAKPETGHEMRDALRSDVERLVAAGRQARAELVTSAFLDAGRHVVRTPLPDQPMIELIEAALRGVADGNELVIGASYDDDANPSGVAVLMGLARTLAGRRFARTVRLVAFAGGARGSRHYAKRLHEQGIHLSGMLSLESVGFLAGRHDHTSLASRLVPPWDGTFVAFVCERRDRRSRRLVEEARRAFSEDARLEARAYALPSLLPLVSLAGHGAFVHEGYPAALITDTGPLRNTHLPPPRDVAAALDYDAMTDVVFGLTSVVAKLGGQHAGTEPERRGSVA